MTIHVNIAKAKATLSDLVARAEAGEEVVIMRNGRPAVVLNPAPKASEHTPSRRKLGVWEHLNIKVDPDLFLKPDLELEALMDEPVWPVK